MDATLATTAADPTNDKLGDNAAAVPRAFGECVDVEELLVGEPLVVVVVSGTGEILAVEITVVWPFTVVVTAAVTVVELGNGSLPAALPHNEDPPIRCEG